MAGGHVALFPMYSPNRRRERRQDVIDFSGLEQDDLFLEGTGAMLFDAVDAAGPQVHHTNVRLNWPRGVGALHDGGGAFGATLNSCGFGGGVNFCCGTAVGSIFGCQIDL